MKISFFKMIACDLCGTNGKLLRAKCRECKETDPVNAPRICKKCSNSADIRCPTCAVKFYRNMQQTTLPEKQELHEKLAQSHPALMNRTDPSVLFVSKLDE